MKQLHFLAEARRDLDEAWLYIAVENETAADDLLDLIQSRALRLLDFPELGRMRPELRTGLRSLSVPPYILYYQLNGDLVEVIRVLHSARDVSAIFDQDQ